MTIDEEKIINELADFYIPQGENCVFCNFYIVKNRNRHIEGHLGLLGMKAIALTEKAMKKEFADFLSRIRYQKLPELMDVLEGDARFYRILDEIEAKYKQLQEASK